MSEKRVYKHPVSLVSETVLELTGPIVHVGLQPDDYEIASQLYVWAEAGVYPNAQKRRLAVYGTGHTIEGPTQHVGSAVDTRAGLVWHLYEHKS